jgi:putative ABC transport system permease protein
LFIRERRQQFVIVAVIAVAVAAAICAISVVYNLPDSPSARFGSAQQRFTFDSPVHNDRRVAAAREALGTIDLIGHQAVAIPGSSDTFDARAQDTDGPFLAGTVRLVDGRLPATAAEVAITDGVAETLGLGIGQTVEVGDARPQPTVVGVIENPYDLGDEFLLLQPGDVSSYESLTVLADVSSEQLQHLQQSTGLPGVEVRSSDVTKTAAAAMLALSTVVFLLVALVASAGFAVVAQRRMRQLGMLAAVGATDRHLKLVLLVHGAIVGIIASISGAVLGLVGWFFVSNRIEQAAEHRIDTFNLPWLLLAGALVAGVLVPIAAAWWPSRAMPRMSIVDAISARPPRPQRARASVVAAVLFLAAGVALTAMSNQTKPLPLIAGMVALVVGILLICPAAVRTMAGFARRAPVTPRVAMRDLGRYQARAGAALAAISLALGIPVATILVATAADRTAAQAAGNGNLADTQLLITINHPVGQEILAPNLTDAQRAELESTVTNLASELGNATIVPLDAAVNPKEAAAHRPLIEIGIPVAGNPDVFHSQPVYVASPGLLEYVGIDDTTIPVDAAILADVPELILIGTGSRGSTLTPTNIGAPRYTSLPNTFITQAGLDHEGLEATPIGWILESPQPLTDAQVNDARETAASSGFSVEARRAPDSHGALKTAATAIGALFALAIVAMTVGTIRSEASGELRTLTATGASSRIRRALTATTAASLALGGVILGTVGAYLGLIGAYAHHLDRLGDIPLAHLITALIGVPLLSWAAGWLMGGSEPKTFARPATD